MAKFLLILTLLILLEHNLEAQVGKYQIDTRNGKDAKGAITILPENIIVEQDSVRITFPIVSVAKDGARTYFFLEGCHNNVSYQGAAIFYNYEHKLSNGRIGMALYIEIRTKQGYSFTRFGLFYYDHDE